MRLYYAENKDRWRQSRLKRRESINAARRARYAVDESLREYHKKNAKEYRKRNPERRRQTEIANRYGLSIAEYDAMLLRQSNKCAICCNEFTKTPHVDHCHSSGIVRGLLCFNCNRAIGHLQDDVEIIKMALMYVERFAK